MTNDKLTKPQQRAIQYFFVDGSGELAISIVCLALAFYFWAEATMPDSPLAKFLNGPFLLIVLAGSFILNRGVRAFKERFTYPRTGYIAYREEKGKKRAIRAGLAAITAMLISGFLAYFLLEGNVAINLMPAISGLAFGLVFGLMAWRTAITRYYILAIFSIATGALLAFSSVNYLASLALYYAIIGVVLLIMGLYTLLTYLRDNPIPQKEVSNDK
jgi:hypothetical protein